MQNQDQPALRASNSGGCERHKPDKIACMKPQIKAIIFDIGGVLLKWDPTRVFQCYFPGQSQAIGNFLAEIDFFEWNTHQDKGRTFAEGIALHSAKFPQYAHLIQAYFDHYEDSITGAITGTADIAQTLKEKGYPLFCLSNWSAETFPRVRPKYPFFDLFDDIILSGEVKLNKPDPAIFNLLLNKIGYSAPECILIDDSQPNIEAARELGFVTIHFSSPEQLQTELQRLKLL
jgi:2-haloacid dehalogenase